MSTRIYQVMNNDTGAQRMVEASSASQAIRYVARETFTASVATPKLAAELGGKGIKIETAMKEVA